MVNKLTEKNITLKETPKLVSTVTTFVSLLSMTYLSVDKLAVPFNHSLLSFVPSIENTYGSCVDDIWGNQ